MLWNLWKKTEKLKEEEGPDLFEYAQMKLEQSSTALSSVSKVEKVEKEGKKKWILLLLLLLPFFSIAGFFSGRMSNQCRVDRYGEITLKNGSKSRAYVQSIQQEGIALLGLDASGKKDRSAPRNEELSIVWRIDFLPDPEEAATPANVAVRQLTADEKKFLGRYATNISGHRAILLVYATRTGYLGATLQFSDWGSRAVEYLHRVTVQGSQISFLRQCAGRECVRIGAGNPIHQRYEGTLSEDLKKIEGTYYGGQNASRWSGVRF